MNIKSNDWKKISKTEIQAILKSVALKNDLLGSGEVSEILKITNEKLDQTTLNYFTPDEAIQKFGDESKSYVKPNGLPYIMDPIRKEVDYIKGILMIQLRMHDDFLKGMIPLDINYLSQYVFYSFIAHSLSKFGWE